MHIDVISGFLGAGKTTLIRKLLEEEYHGNNVVVIENELGQVGLDGEFLQTSAIEVKEIYSGCICCTLKGNIQEAIEEVITTFQPEVILIEPSGVAKLSSVLEDLEQYKGDLNLLITVVDPQNYALYKKNFPDFFMDQLKNASTLIFSRTQLLEEMQLNAISADLMHINEQAVIIDTPWDQLSTTQLQKHSISEEHWHQLLKDISPSPPPFQIWGASTEKTFSYAQIEAILQAFDTEELGHITRAKGILKGSDGWYRIDYCGGEKNIAPLAEGSNGRVCVIGEQVNKDTLATLFHAKG